MAYNKNRPIGLTLPDDDLARLDEFARVHDWKLTHAARVIIRERLRLEYPDAPEAPAEQASHAEPSWP